MNPHEIKKLGFEEIQCAIINVFKDCLCDCLTTIEAYAGQFNATEVRRNSFTAPALFVTILSGSEETSRGEFDTQFAAFLITKSADREDRAEDGLVFLSRVLGCIRKLHLNLDCRNVAMATGRSFQNLYSETFDKQGIQCWAINWNHRVIL